MAVGGPAHVHPQLTALSTGDGRFGAVSQGAPAYDTGRSRTTEVVDGSVVARGGVI